MMYASTRHLTSARLEVVADARARRVLRSILVAVLVALAVVAAARLLADGAAVTRQRSDLQRENSGLRAEVARLSAELEIERATHAALDQQVGVLNQQVSELESRLAFVNAQRNRGRAPARND
jgi:cell division protein FtsB